jgi:hypothetical protein
VAERGAADYLRLLEDTNVESADVERRPRAADRAGEPGKVTAVLLDAAHDHERFRGLLSVIVFPPEANLTVRAR